MNGIENSVYDYSRTKSKNSIIPNIVTTTYFCTIRKYVLVKVDYRRLSLHI